MTTSPIFAPAVAPTPDELDNAMTATDDLIERLTQSATQSRAHGWDGDAKDLDAAAAELTRLQARVAALEAENALEKAFSEIELKTCIELRARADKAEAERDALLADAERYWPFVEMVGMKRPPRGQDEVDAYEMIRERKRADRKEGK